MCKYGFKNVLISSKNFPMESYFAERIICLIRGAVDKLVNLLN